MKRFLVTAIVALLLFAVSASASDVPIAALSPYSPPTDDGWKACSVDINHEWRRQAACRVQVTTPCKKNIEHLGYGSGTVINKRTLTDGRTLGLVLTCAHILPAHQSAEQLKGLLLQVQFVHITKAKAGLVLAVDWNNDLSVIAIYVDKDQPVIPLAVSSRNGESLNVCGFGPDAKFRSRLAKSLGYVSAGWDGGDGKVIPAPDVPKRYTTTGQNQLYIQAANVYVGDSGGGIVTQDNKLAAVLWGGSGSNNFGTYSGTIKQFLRRRLPASYQWGNEACCPPGTSSSACGTLRTPAPATSTTRPRGTPNYPMPDLDPLPAAPEIVVVPEKNEDHEAIVAALTRIQQGIDTLKAKADTPGVDVLPAITQLQDQVSELANREQSVTLSVQSPKFISPSYVDVSVLWALQQGTGVDHMVLIANTADENWQQLSSEYESARERFPAIVLFDVTSSGIRFYELPQLVVYPVNPDKQPVIVKGDDLVATRLQAIVQDDPGGFLGDK
jgi:hypothetical protein